MTDFTTYIPKHELQGNLVSLGDLFDHAVYSKRLRKTALDIFKKALVNASPHIKWGKLRSIGVCMHVSASLGELIQVLDNVPITVLGETPRERLRAMCQNLPWVKRNATTNSVSSTPKRKSKRKRGTSSAQQPPKAPRKTAHTRPVPRRHPVRRQLVIEDSSESSDSSFSISVSDGSRSPHIIDLLHNEDSDVDSDANEKVAIPDAHTVYMPPTEYRAYVKLQLDALHNLSHARMAGQDALPDHLTRLNDKMDLAIANQFRQVALLTPVDPKGYMTGADVRMVPETNGERMYTVYERIKSLGYDPVRLDTGEIGLCVSKAYQAEYKTFPLKEERGPASRRMYYNVYNLSTCLNVVDGVIDAYVEDTAGGAHGPDVAGGGEL